MSNPNGPIGSYTWQVGTTSAFTKIIASGFTDMDPDASVPTPTADKVSGLPNGTYFWRVKATQLVGGAQGSVDSAWSAVRSFTVTGLGAAPAAPAFSTPATGASFHVREFFNIKWSAVAGAHYYLLEVDDEPTFSYPLTLTTNALTFGTQAQAGWGNALERLLSSPGRFRRQCPQSPFHDAYYSRHEQCAGPAGAYACLTRGGSNGEASLLFRLV